MFSASFFADAGDSFVNQIFQFVCHRHVSEDFMDLNDSLIEQRPFDGILDELRMCAFLDALGCCFRGSDDFHDFLSSGVLRSAQRANTTDGNTIEESGAPG
jgi:hypothetical protein